MEEEKGSMLLPQDKYLEAGVHIGTRFKTIDMKPFIFKRRDDGLFILDLRRIDERIRLAAKVLSKYRPEEVLVVASRLYSANAAGKFAALTGVGIAKGRFIPGTMTNIKLPVFREPKIMLVCDPKGEAEAVREAAKRGIPVIALCDSDNNTAFVDWVVPTNNKGRKALALVFYLLSRELMMAQGKISSYDQFDYRPDYFERFEDEKTEQIAREIEAAEAKAEEGDITAPVPEEKKEEAKKES
ncbi:MAG: 30S ribosomal protein S2 [Candidatus Micrarchaeota archaeon]